MILNYGGMLGDALSSGIGQGMQMGQLVDQRRQQEAAQLAEQEAQARQQATLQQASQLYTQGTPDQIAEFALQNPEAGQLLQRQMQFKSDATKQNMMDGMRDIMLNPQNTEAILKNRIAMVEQAGGDASDTIADLAQFQQDPDAYRQTVERSFAMMDPSGYAAFKRAGPQEAKPLTALEQATLQDKALDRELKMMEYEDKKLNRQLKRETDELKRQEIQQKIDLNKTQAQEAAQQKATDQEAARQFSKKLVDLALEIKNNPELEEATGVFNSMFPTLDNDTQDLINKAQTLKAMLTKENLDLMSGVLTDKDIEMLGKVSTDLNVTDWGIKGSTKEAKKSLQNIIDDLRPKTGIQKNADGKNAGIQKIGDNKYKSLSGLEFEEVK